MIDKNKINTSFLKLINEIILLYNDVGDIIEEPIQDNVDNLVSGLEKTQNTFDVLKNMIASTLKNIANPDNDEVEGGETEEGIKL